MMQEEEIIYEDLQMSEVQNDTTIEEVIQVVEVTDVETFDIEMSEAFPASGEIDALNHALLYHRELDDAHPISAITGLREELNSIEALQTIYSDKKGNADYYEWADGHAIGENGIGYFVTLNNDACISICTGDDIFGVVVDSAAFVGGQDDVARDDHYGLVATTGVVPVRRELDVAEGDYVVSNSKGWAEKATSDYGYKVVALRDIQGVPHAIIKLNITADQINLMGAEIKEFDSRMDAAETNIVSAVNVANQAYQKAVEAGSASTDASNKAQNALDTSNKVLDSVGSLENAATQSQIIAAQAKAIAEGTMVSAEAMCKEAVDEANKALVEATELREEFKEKIEEIDAELDNTTLELETIKKDIIVTKEELQQSVEDVKKDVGVANDEIKQDIEDTKTSLKEAQEDVASLQEDIEPLVSWPEGSDNPTGIAGFVAQADENSARIGSLVEWQGETDKSIAAFKQEVADNYATQTMLSEVGDNLVLFKQEVSDTYATQEMVSAVDDNLAKYKQEVTDTYATQEMVSSVDNALTSYKQEASKNYATQQMLSSVEDNLTDYKQEVTDTYATQKMVTTVGDNLANFKQEVKDDYATQEMLTNVDNALTSYKQEVTKNYATQQMVSSVENNLASYKQEVMDTYATQQMVTTVDNNLTSYKQEVTNTYATQEMVSKLETDTSKALADYKQEVKDGYATQEMVTSLETETGKALSDYKQEVGKTYATNTSLANLKTETTNAIAASKEEATATYASKSDLTSFETTTSSSMARIEQKADANGASLQTLVANINKYSVGTCSQSNGFEQAQAESVLESGMIHVPTTNHTESKPASRTFTIGYYYTWDGSKWVTSSASAVFHSNSYQNGTANSPYWYIPGTNNITQDKITYDSHTLYKWESYTNEAGTTCYHWVAVATLEGSVNNRAVSQIRQDANNITLEVASVKGDVANVTARVGTTEATLSSLSAWKNGENTSESIIRQITNDDGASVVIAALQKNGDTINEMASLTLGVSKENAALVVDAKNINLNGAVTANNNVTISTDGKITAKAGDIAGLTMSNQKLYGIGGGNMYTNNNGQSYPFDHIMGINSVYSAAKNSYTAFWIGAKFPRKNATAGDTNSWGTVDNEGMNTVFGADDYAMAEKYIIGATDVESAGGADFRVSHQGQLFARNAIIDGTIYARQGGTIGGFTIGDTYITSNTSKTTYKTSADGVYVGTDGIGLGQNKFYVSDKGVMYSESGTIGGWSISPGSISGSASIQDDNKKDITVSTGMMKPSYQTQLTNENAYTKLSLVNPNSYYPYKGVAFYAGATDNKPNTGKFCVLNDGSLYATAASITGSINATSGEFILKDGAYVKIGTDCESLAIYSNDYSIDVTTLNGTGQSLGLLPWAITYYGGGGYSFPIQFAYNPDLEVPYKNLLAGEWQVGSWFSGSIITSDRNRKNSIQPQANIYSLIFDKLKPITFKYNSGTSDRTHTGFIAQEVEDAVLSVGLTTKDFAAVCYDLDDEGNKKNYGVRYEELVSLCVYEIQKLKARVAELEAQQNDSGE